MNKEILEKCIWIGVIGLTLAGVDLIGLAVCADRKADLVRAYVAGKDLGPRTLIREEHIEEVDVPRAYLGGACTDKKDIVGKYTEIQGMIPAGSPFYASMLYNGTSLPDRPDAQLCQGQVIFTMETDMAASGGFSAGQRADLHLTVERPGGGVLSGPVIEHARIVAIRDHKGLDIDDPKSTGVPYMLSLAIKKEDIDMLNMAEKVGELRVYAGADSYNTDVEAERVKDAPVLEYLKTLQINDKNEEES